MRDTPIGIADVVKAADALGLRGDALAAMVAMFGFALPSDEEPAAPRPTREPEPDNEDDGSDIESVATAAEALPRTARKLTPVRQAATAASTPVDPLVPGRDLRRRAADRERLRLATCRIEAELGPANGVLVSPTQIVAVFGWDGERGLGSHFTASFPNSTAVAIVEGTEERVTTTRGRGAPALTLLKLSEPIGDIAPMTLGRAARGPWDGYGSPTWLPADAHFMTGTSSTPRASILGVCRRSKSRRREHARSKRIWAWWVCRSRRMDTSLACSQVWTRIGPARAGGVVPAGPRT